MNNFRSTPIKFNEAMFLNPEEISNNIQILRTGTFFHEGQHIEVKKSDLNNMIKNFKNEVRGIDLMLDFSHESEKEAAAWFTDLFLSEDGKELWATVDWTNDGSESVKEKKYRYISADFNFSYKDNETLKEYGPTLLGAGLTNRPVVKKMNPTILSEENYNNTKENKMNFEEEFNKAKAKNEKLEKEMAELKESMKDSKFSEKEADLKKREETVKLAEDKIEADVKLAEKKGVFDKMLSEGKAVEAQREHYMSGDFAKFAENASVVNLSENGNGGAGNSEDKNEEKFEGDTPAQDEVISLAEKKATEDKIELDVAISCVLSENAELRTKYEKEVNE